MSDEAQAIIVGDLNTDNTLTTQNNTPTVQATTAQQLAHKVSLSQARSKPPLHDYQTMFNTSNVYNVTLAPNGKWISYFEKRGTDNTRTISLWIYNVAQQKNRKLFTAKHLSNAAWTADSQSLFLDTNKSIAVIGINTDAAPHILFQKNHRHHDGFIAIDYFNKDSAIVRQWHKKSKQYQVKRYNSQGKSEVIYQTTQRFIKLGLNHLGQPSFVIRQNEAPNNKGERYIVDISSTPESVIWQCQWVEDCGAIYYNNFDHQLLIRTNKNTDLSRLAQIDIKSGTLTTIHSDPLKRANYADAVFEFNEKTKQLNAPLISYHGDRKRYYATDKGLQPHLNFITDKLATTSFNISVPMTTSLSTHPWLISDNNNRESATQYYLYQPQTKTLTRPLKNIIQTANKHKKLLPSQDIAHKFAINYHSRDGFLINGYITLPQGIDLSKAPLVTKVHGGPWSRVTEHYSRATQMLTNRGYIVFEPNFRSSTGFGKEYLTSTAGEHGDGRIQQDIIDGVHFLLKHNIGDKNRMAVIGHSFGAYSTLAALAFTPDLFQVGFAGAPPHDIGRSAKLYYRFTKQTNKFDRQYFMKKLVVDWDNKEAMSEHYQRSPAANANKIKKPLVMWAGKNDRRVFIADVKNYALTIEELGKSVSLFIDPKALHSPNSRLGMLAYQYILEKTLSDNIGGSIKPIDPIKNKKLYRFIKKNMAIDHNNLINQ